MEFFFKATADVWNGLVEYWMCLPKFQRTLNYFQHVQSPNEGYSFRAEVSNLANFKIDGFQLEVVQKNQNKVSCWKINLKDSFLK